MKQSPLSSQAQQLLKTHGWYEGRHVDPSTDLEELQVRGFPISEAAIAFIREFGGLQLNLVNGPHSFDIREAIKWLSPIDVPFLATLIGEPLTPIGMGGRRIFLMAQEGSVVLLNDEWRYFTHCSTLSVAIDNILLIHDPLAGMVWLSKDQQPPGYQDDQDCIM